MNVPARTDGRLAPATQYEITAELTQLWENLPLQSGDPATLLNGYLIALAGKPQWAVNNAVRKFLRGEVKGASTKFCPRAPELAQAVAREMEHVYEEVAAQQAEEAAQARKQDWLEHLPSEDERARVRFKMSLWNVAQGDRLDSLAETVKHGSLMDLIQLGESWGVTAPDDVRRQVQEQP